MRPAIGDEILHPARRSFSRHRAPVAVGLRHGGGQLVRELLQPGGGAGVLPQGRKPIVSGVECAWVAVTMTRSGASPQAAAVRARISAVKLRPGPSSPLCRPIRSAVTSATPPPPSPITTARA